MELLRHRLKKVALPWCSVCHTNYKIIKDTNTQLSPNLQPRHSTITVRVADIVDTKLKFTACVFEWTKSFTKYKPGFFDGLLVGGGVSGR